MKRSLIRSKLPVVVLTFVLLFLSVQPSKSQVDPVDKTGLAIGGYDLVSYFTSIKPLKGSPDFTSEINGARYLFSSKENKAKFDANPQMYMPQYEGYCALAIGTTMKKISIDPETYKITDGKLYLFFNGRSFSGTVFNSLEPWLEDEERLISRSDKNWPMVKPKKYKHKD